MNKNALTFEDVGLVRNPFESIISNIEDENIISYNIYGRDDELRNLSNFIQEAVNSTEQHRFLLSGDYGTGKTHHLQKIKSDILNGEYGENVYAIYISNLGISFKYFYKNIIEGVSSLIPKLSNFIRELPDVEPEESIEKSYAMEALRNNIIANLKLVITKAENEGVKGIFLLVDEAEDIVNSNEQDAIQYFVQSLLHFANALQSHPLHVIMGFSSAALEKVTMINGEKSEQGKLGEAFLQRYSQKETMLGHLRNEDAELMVLDRLNKARLTPRENDWYPIKREIISVVNRLVSGHPREVLAILGKAISDTLESGNKEICGSEILQTLSLHTSFYSQSFILDWGSLETLINNLGDEDISLRDDFERLVGRLVGEDAEVTEDDFTDSDAPEKLVKPINGIRILKRVTDSGWPTYKIHQDALDHIFKEKRYESNEEFTIAKETSALNNNPESYQSELTTGLWKTVLDGWKAEFQSKVLFSDDKTAILGKVKPLDGLNSLNCLFVAYMGHQFPTTLYEDILEYLEKKKDTFAYILYKGPELGQSPQYKALMNRVNGTPKEKLLQKYIYTQSVSGIQTDSNKLMGLLKALGNSKLQEDPNLTLNIDKVHIFTSLDMKTKLSQFIENKIFIYFEGLNREILEFLARNHTRSYTAPELRSELGTTYLSSVDLNRLQAQKVIVKGKGKSVKISSLEDNPIWKEIYKFISKEKIVSLGNISTALNAEYIFLESPENTLAWYLNKILIPCGLIEHITKPDDIYYQVVDFSGKFANKITESKTELELANRALSEAEPLLISLDDISADIQTCTRKVEKMDAIFIPSPDDITTLDEIIRTIRTNSEDIKKRIQKKLQEYLNTYESLNDKIKLLESELNKSTGNGIISESERLTWSTSLHEKLDSVKQPVSFISAKKSNKLSKRDYRLLDQTYRDLDTEIKQIQEIINTRSTSKGPCEIEAGSVSYLITGIQNLFSTLAEKNYKDISLTQRYEKETERFEQFKSLFNSSQYTDALTLIKDISSKLTSIHKTLNSKNIEYANYEDRIQTLKSSISEDDAELRDEISNAERELHEWNFSEVSLSLSKISEILKKRNAPKSKDELFKEFMLSRENQNLTSALNDYSLDDVLQHIKVLYQKGEISDLQIIFK